MGPGRGPGGYWRRSSTPGWVQRALTAEDWRGFPGNEPGGGEGFSKVERIAQQIFDKLAELHVTYVHEPAESVPGAQRVRAVDEVLSLGRATCLDMCATFCSAALDAGIYPLLLTVRQEGRRRHALVLVPVDRRWSFGVPPSSMRASPVAHWSST